MTAPASGPVAGPRGASTSPRTWLQVRLSAATVMAFAFAVVWQAPPTWLGGLVAAVSPPVPVLSQGRTVVVPPPAAGASTSALTASGLGAFANLKVSVSQTTDLVNQALTVSWTGGKPTPEAPSYPRDFLQIMQCWGDDLAKGPDRSQCVFGARAPQFGGAITGDRVATRQLEAAGADPLETGGSAGSSSYVSFISWSGLETTGVAAGAQNPDFDRFNTNEVPAARTFADGSGSTVFEAMTDVQSPGIGCGRVIAANDPLPPGPDAQVGAARRCWLVVVPRGETEVSGAATTKVVSSPLSLTNWANRIAFPLSFRPVGSACPLGSAETPTKGSELAAEAVYNWQPKLCANNGPVFGFTTLSANVLNDVIGGDTPGLGFTNEPVPAAKVPAGSKVVYAPILLSGLTIAVSYDRQPALDAPAAELANTSRPITPVKLTPRVVAKLLTASYQTGPAPGAPHVRGTVDSVVRDPDFLFDNPDFAAQTGTLDIVVPFGNDSLYALLWDWVMADKDAADFLAGLPDNLNATDKNVRKNTGMRINPFYQGLELPQTSFPKIDPYYQTSAEVKRYNADHAAGEQALPLGQQDYHQYGTSLPDGAVAALRGDTLSRTVFDLVTGLYGKVSPTGIGRRTVMGLTDTASAGRYSVTPALLRNAAGSFVGPDGAGLAAGLAAMRPGADGVLVPDVTAAAPAAYPLTVLTYAATRPSALTAADATSYAALIRYAVGDGQTPGTTPGSLPDGYAALPTALRDVAKKAADDVQARVGGTATTTSSSSSSSTTTATSSTTGSTTSTAAGSTSSSTTAAATTTSRTTVRATTSTKAAATVKRGVTTGARSAAAGGAGAANAQGSPGASSAPTGTPLSSPFASTPAGTTDTTQLAQATTPSESAGAGRYAVLTALMLGISGSLAGPALPKLARRLS